jgi:hypothetical protein
MDPLLGCAHQSDLDRALGANVKSLWSNSECWVQRALPTVAKARIRTETYIWSCTMLSWPMCAGAIRLFIDGLKKPAKKQ